MIISKEQKSVSRLKSVQCLDKYKIELMDRETDNELYNYKPENSFWVEKSRNSS